MRVPKQKHNASSKQAPQHSVVGKSATQPGKSPQQSPLVQTLFRVGNAGNHAAILNRAPDHQQSTNKNLLLHLQRQYGNSYVNQVVKQAQHNSSASTQQAPIQTKLTIGSVGDKYEREADQTAAAVVQRINAPSPVQSAGGQAIQREKTSEEELQKKPQITAIQREVMPGEDEQRAQMKAAVELVQTKKPEEDDKQKQAAKKTALAAPPQPKKIKEEDKKKLLRKRAASNSFKSKKQEEDDKLKHLQKKSDAIAEHGHKEEDEDKLSVHKKSHPDAGSTKKPEEEDKLKHLQKKSDTHAEHGHKEEDEDKLPVHKKSHPGAEPHKKPEEDDDKHLMQAKSDVSAGHEDKDEEDKMAQMQPLVQRRSGEGGTDATADVESAIKHARGKGRPLPDHVRSSMENAFGADFSDVKIHADTHADQLNRSIQARAFTTGQDVFFRQGEFALGSKRGQELLAHELTHVVQQNGNAVQPKSLTKQEKKQNKLQSKTKFNESAEPAAIPEQNAQVPSNYLAPTAAPAASSERNELLQQQALAEVAGNKEVEIQRQEADAGIAPTSPEADGEFQEVVSKSQGVAEEQQEHQPPEEKSKEAQDAAEPPANEVETKAEGRQVSEKMEQAPTPPFDAAAFRAALMARIRQITPQNLDEMDKFKDSNKLTSVKNDVTGKVDEAQKESQGPLEETAKETPSTSGIEAKQVTPLPPNDPGSAPADVGGEKAAPKSKGYGEIEAPLEQSSQELDQRLAEANITEEQLANSNEPQFQAALDSKKQAQANAVDSPKGYRQFEDSKLSQAKSEASTTAIDSLQGMHQGRSQSFEQVTGKQEEGKGKDEAARTKIAGDLGQIYDKTKTTVEKILNDLDVEVDREFDAGAADAKQTFEDYVSKRMDEYKAARYRGIGGFFNGIRDWFAGLPDEVNRFYEEGRDLYLQKMDGVIDKIAQLVATKLNEAKTEVTNGKKQVEEYVKQLPEDLKEIGQEAAEDILSQFDELEQEINSKQDELIDRLANKYKENLDALDARIKELQEANKGFLQKALDFIVGVIKTIVELAKLLANVLARAASAIPSILKDPIGFIRNLVDALKQGFLNFVANIKQHLMQGLISWLTGTLSSAGIQMPESLDAKGLFGLVVQVLGITYQTIRARAVKRLGEEKVGYLEQNFEMFKILATQGIAGLWQVVKDKIGDVKTMVLEPIQNYIIENVIKGGIQWIIGLMSPASAFIKACQAIVQIVQFFMENAQRIAELINSIIDAVLAIANGAIEKAVQGVENALAQSIPLVIDFLAKLLGLGNIGQKVQGIIQKLRQPVERSVDWVITQGVKFAKTLDKKFKQSKAGKKIQSPREEARKKKEAAQKWVKNKKEAVEKRYEREKNKLLKSKAGKKELDALKKKRDAAKKKFDATKNWPTKKLEALMGGKDKTHQAIGKDKAGKKIAKDNKIKQRKQQDEQKHEQRVKAGLAAIDKEETRYLKQGKIAREDAEKVASTVKRQHPVFKVLTVIDGGKTWDYDYVASPGKVKKGRQKTSQKPYERTVVPLDPEIEKNLTHCNSYLENENSELAEFKKQGNVKVELEDEKKLKEFRNQYQKLDTEKSNIEKEKDIQVKRNPELGSREKKLSKEVRNFLHDLQMHYGEFTSGGGSHMRKHPEAKGTIVFYGSFEKPSEKEFAGIKLKKVEEKEFTALTQIEKGRYYRLTYIKATIGKVDNAVYYPQQFEIPEGKLKGRDTLNIDKASEKKDPKNQKEFKTVADKLDQDKDAPQVRTQVYTNQARRKDRGKGQIFAMNNVNAAAYAYGKGINNALDKNWEWLHIRGAGLGGETESTNLVAGTYSANSHMIPFELQIKALSTMANDSHPLNVEWKIAIGDKGKFHCKKITLEWYAEKGLELDGTATQPISKNEPMVVEFDPERATVFDKYQSKAAWKTYKKYIADNQNMITD
ncbi:MAG: DUF4157 domain-containing protein [Nostoc desertorum CM1-VF14]|jgi:hypothetical protein|nr:DUF4157 domain-containing protein [Nostoc desertorum CM1-VF14]